MRDHDDNRRNPRRRDLLSLLGAAATAPLWPAVARAQSRLPMLGFLSSESADVYAGRVRALRQGLGEYGFVEGKNIAIEYRWAEGRNDRLPALATDLIQRGVSVIAANGTAALAAKKITAAIPIVFVIGADPVGLGLVASLARPGGNVTGVTTLSGETGPKRMELARELFPDASAMAVLINPTSPTAANIAKVMAAAGTALGLRETHMLHASSDQDFEGALGAVTRLGAAALVVSADSFFNNRSEQIAALALRHRVATIYQFREFAAAGGLMSYGNSFAESYRLVGSYVGRILKGENPANLPVQQPTKLELILNMKTASALGLTFPMTLLSRADDVIE
jgi:putative tryptophan/tyrosine transport system substrate-binding protein